MKAIIVLSIATGLLLTSCATNDYNARLDGKSNEKTGREIHYTCRMSDGEVVVTTENATADDPSVPKSEVFIGKTEYAPINLAGIEADPAEVNEELLFFEEVLIRKLAREARDWKVGTERDLNIEAEEQAHLSEEERMIEINRRHTQPKTIRYAENIFSRVTGAECAVGETVVLHRGVKGQVTSIENGEVLVEFKAESNEPVDGPFGPVEVHDKGDSFEIEISTREGRIVRVGPAVGRISEVKEDTFVVDYSHPFGGESLTCNVAVDYLSENAFTFSTEGTTEIQEPEETSIDELTASVESNQETSAGETAQKGDLVEVEYTAAIGSGEVVWTTRSDVARNPEMKKIDGYQGPDVFEPETLLVGSQGDFPGISEGVVGMQVGERKTVVVPAENAYGSRNPSLMQKYDRIKTIPLQITMSAQDYVTQFGGFPVKDKTVTYNAYLSAQVTEVAEQGAVLALSPVDETVESEFGLTRMSVVDETIQMKLFPELGADFNLEDRSGRVVAVDDLQFTVDYNDPLAGEAVDVEMQLVSLTKAEEFAGKDIQWIEDYNEGLAAIEALNKPAVLLLYADWCGYCKKMQNNTLVDPRIKMMSDDFVWIRVNSDKQKELKTFYGQTGFPLTILLDNSGEVMNKISGFKKADDFQEELEKVLDGNKTSLTVHTNAVDGRPRAKM